MSASSTTEGTPADPLREAREAFRLLRDAGWILDDLNAKVEAAFAALATKPAETPTRVERVDNIGNPGQGHPTESAGKSPEAAVVVEEMFSLLCSVSDNLGDMPVSDEWADTTSNRADALLRQLEPHIITAEWEHAQRHIARLAETQRSSNANGSDEQTSPSVQSPSRDDRIARLMAEGMERPDAEKFADEIGAARASVQPPAPEPVAWLHHYHKIGGGRTYVEADVCDPRHKFAPESKPGFEWVRVEPLYASPPIAQRGAALTDAASGKLWSVLRSAMAQAAAIDNAYSDQGYEVRSAHLDAAASEWADKIAALSPERPEPPAPSTTGEKP